MFGEIGVLSLLNKKYNQKDCFYLNIIVFENYNILQKYLTHTTNKVLNFYTHTHTCNLFPLFKPLLHDLIVNISN